MSELPAILDARLAQLPAGALWVGYSGGLDSTVLLHALAHLPSARGRGLAALHVCHGLHPDAGLWARQAQAFATSLEVPFQSVDVNVSGIAREGVEAAARRARHAAFATVLPSPAVLALAHHRGDQVETLLLRLLHGAGQEGLAAMRELRPLRRDDPRWLWRPLLDLPRVALAAHAREHHLDFVEDPANAHPDYARNRVRQRIVPAMTSAFAEAEARIAASARRLREEADALDALAGERLRELLDPTDRSLACVPLRSFPVALLRRIVGGWLDHLGLPRPPPDVWTALRPELIDARTDATPVLAWRGARLRRYRGRLHGDDGSDAEPGDWSLAWDGRTALTLPAGLGTLALDPAPATASSFLVRNRRGGEVLRWHGHRRELKKLLQHAGLAPWLRQRLPLLFGADGELLAVGTRWHADGFAHWLQEHDTALHLHYD